MENGIACKKCGKKIRLIRKEEGFITEGLCEDGKGHTYSYKELVEITKTMKE